VEVCPTDALTPRAGGRGMTYRKSACIGCHKCIDACPVQVIGWDEEEDRPIVCLFCGQCAHFCPHQCLEMVDAES